jgi:hypothetical protein
LGKDTNAKSAFSTSQDEEQSKQAWKIESEATQLTIRHLNVILSNSLKDQ